MSILGVIRNDRYYALAAITRCRISAFGW